MLPGQVIIGDKSHNGLGFAAIVADVLARVLQRILALTTAIWHNGQTGQSSARSPLAYDH
jgi:hypothetical protein